MKIKKILSAITLSAVLSLNALSAVPMAAFADADGGFTAQEIADSETKPTLSISKLTVSAADAKASPVQTLSVSIKGADAKYSSTGFHIYFDERLTLVPNRKGSAATKGEAIQDLSGESYTKGNCLFLTTAGKKNMGADGVMWTFQLQLPDDAAEGDVFDVKLAYEKGKSTEDVFIDDINDKASQLMQAWVFTKGMENGYIKVGGSSSASTTAGDANCDGSVDLADAVLIMQYVANPDKFGINGSDKNHMTEQGKKNSDVSGSGDGVTSKDALAIQKYTLKIISSLPE